MFQSNLYSRTTSILSLDIILFPIIVPTNILLLYNLLLDKSSWIAVPYYPIGQFSESVIINNQSYSWLPSVKVINVAKINHLSLL